MSNENELRWGNDGGRGYMVEGNKGEKWGNCNSIINKIYFKKMCFFLMDNDSEHLFMCLWALFTSSLEKCLFRFFAHFLIGFVFLE